TSSKPPTRIRPDRQTRIHQTNVSTIPSCRRLVSLHVTTEPIPRSDGRPLLARACFVSGLRLMVGEESDSLSQEFDVVCLGGGVAGEAIAVGLEDSGLTLAVVERELVGGECPYWGCVPSKTLLRSGETLSEAGRARVLAASRVDWAVDFPKVSTR